MLAAKEGHVDTFTDLLERGAHIYDVDMDGRNVMHMAAQRDHMDLLKVSALLILPI